MGKILMKRLLFYITVLLLAGQTWMLTSCSNVGCTENRNSLPLAGFYSMRTGEAITPDSLEIGGVGAPSDSLLLDESSRVQQLYLPFRSTKPQTVFYIRYKAKDLDFPWLVDTLKFDYESLPYFASEDCGAMYHYHITKFSFTTHLIDSAAVTDSLITNVDRETIRIFFRTAEPSEPDNPSDNEND